MPSQPGDYYRRLRLSRNATRQEIKAAFRRLARQYHPELHPNQPGARMKYRAIREAYEVLIDRIQRQRYDQHCQGFGYAQQSASPQTPSDFYIRGVRNGISQRYRAALNDYSRAIKLDDQFAEAYLRRAEIRYVLKDDSGVLSDCQQAIALNSTEAKTYFYQGRARYRLGYVQSALAAFTDAITCDPDDAYYYYHRGLAYQELNELDAAAQDLRKSAQLFREQGDLANYQQLLWVLRPLGTAGRSRIIKLLGKIPQQLFKHLPGGKTSSGNRHQANGLTITALPNPFPNGLPGDYANEQTSEQANGEASGPTSGPNGEQASPDPSEQSPEPPFGRSAQRPRQSPSTPHIPNNLPWSRFRPSRLPRRMPDVSSRPDYSAHPEQHPVDFRTGMTRVFTLLSNPAGEMVPLYHQLSHHQVTLVGYGLAVLGNLIFVGGAMQHVLINSWLVASWFWASGGLAFVAMMALAAVVRSRLRVHSLWVADIFIIGTAMVPLGTLAAMSAIAQYAPNNTLQLIIILCAMLWTLSHTLLTLYSGFCRIHRFPPQLAAWFAPLVLAVGICTGIGTWGIVSAGI
ncbi:MAG: J domain-containing protein [Cyanobacteria bacterium P01_F01_bin.53]